MHAEARAPAVARALAVETEAKAAECLTAAAVPVAAGLPLPRRQTAVTPRTFLHPNSLAVAAVVDLPQVAAPAVVVDLLPVATHVSAAVDHQTVDIHRAKAIRPAWTG